MMMYMVKLDDVVLALDAVEAASAGLATPVASASFGVDTTVVTTVSGAELAVALAAAEDVDEAADVVELVMVGAGSVADLHTEVSWNGRAIGWANTAAYSLADSDADSDVDELEVADGVVDDEVDTLVVVKSPKGQKVKLY